MGENSKLDWLKPLGGEFPSKESLQNKKDLYDMLGIINVVVPVGDKENEKYKLYISKLQERHIDKELSEQIKNTGRVFSNVIRLFNKDYNEASPRPRDKNFIAYNTIRKDEETYWKGFLDELNIEYKIEEYPYCWWNEDDLFPENYKGVWVNEEQFKLVENSEKYINELKSLHENIEKHYISKAHSNELFSEDKKRQEALERGLKKLNSLVGMKEVKAKVNEIIAKVSADKRAEKLGRKKNVQDSHHTIIIGNPGTGKTVVVRALCDIYYGLGILKTNKLVETNKTELVGGYMGQTEKNVEKVFKQAIKEGGMIFVDEFHQLYSEKNLNGYGVNALEAMVPYIENHRGEFVLVVAGYKKPMEVALKYDPGFLQRFSEILETQDHSKSETLKIFKNLCAENDMKISRNSNKKLIEMFENLPEGGNGRIARDIFEHSRTKQALRIFKLSDEQFKKKYNTITLDDIEKSIKDIISKYDKNEEETKKRVGFDINF